MNIKYCLFCLLLTAGGVVAGTAADKSTAKSIRLPADNTMAELKPDPGVETVRANCVACHSTDYVVRQPGSDAKRWDQEVRKMITAFGAPITEPDAKIIVKYLASAYGPLSKVESSPQKGHSDPLK